MYVAQDIPAFVMYYIYGVLRASLLTQSVHSILYVLDKAQCKHATGIIDHSLQSKEY